MACFLTLCYFPWLNWLKIYILYQRGMCAQVQDMHQLLLLLLNHITTLHIYRGPQNISHLPTFLPLLTYLNPRYHPWHPGGKSLTSRSQIQSHFFMHQPERLAANWGKCLRGSSPELEQGSSHNGAARTSTRYGYFFEILPVWRHLSHAAQLSTSTEAFGSNPFNILVALWCALHSLGIPGLENFISTGEHFQGWSSVDTLSCNQPVQHQLEKERSKRRKALTLEVEPAWHMHI